LNFFLAASAPAIRNPGFEAAALDGWTVSLHQKSGRDGVMRVDGGQAKEGKQSLLLEAEDPVALAAGQKIFLPVGTLWQLRGWVRTKNLERCGSGGLHCRDRRALRQAAWGERPATLARRIGARRVSRFGWRRRAR
jgi:hypothetical protein